MQTAQKQSKKRQGRKEPSAIAPAPAIIPEETPAAAAAEAAERDVASSPAEPAVVRLDLNKIVTSAYNPRRNIREESLQELAESIRQVGVLQPICVRPKDEGYEIVYGERRYWAAALAGLPSIPAFVRTMTDAEAEDAAITENLQREDVTPLEEAAAYKRALESGRHSVESLVGKFGKSEAYIRSRLKLNELIEELAELLDREEISVGVAIEIAKYDVPIQQEVYREHFSENCYASWKNTRIKEIARRLYDRYMTKLSTYHFDKTDCATCMHNTANQVLFADCDGTCAGCQNRSCMVRKNEEYLLHRAVTLLQDDPRTVLATDGTMPSAVSEALETNGYHVEMLAYSSGDYGEAPDAPEEPDPAAYEDEEAFAAARAAYESDLAAFTELTRELEYRISEGRVRKYAVIGALDVDIRYAEVEEEQKEVVLDDGRKVVVAVLPESPIESLQQQDLRNRQTCYEHITSDMKDLFYETRITNKPLQKEEIQMFYYAVMKHLGDERLRQCGIKSREKWCVTPEERFAAAGRLTEKQHAALLRTFLLSFFRQNAPDYNCTDEVLDTKLMCRFADLNFEEQSRAVQQKYLSIFEKRHDRLQERIDGIRAQEEERLMAEMEQPEPEFEPEDLPAEQEETPAADDPQPALPTLIPVEPECDPNMEERSFDVAQAA